MKQYKNVALCTLKTVKGNKLHSTLGECYFYIKPVRKGVMLRCNQGNKYIVEEQSFKTCFRLI